MEELKQIARVFGEIADDNARKVKEALQQNNGIKTYQDAHYPRVDEAPTPRVEKAQLQEWRWDSRSQQWPQSAGRLSRIQR